MLSKSTTVVAAAVIVAGTATVSLAKNGGPPKIDIQTTCRENIGALRTVLGGEIRQDMNVCMNDERDARDQLVKNWTTYPALAKQRCVKPQEYLPGYIEWLVCIEMTRDALHARKEQSGMSAPEAGTTRRSSNRRTSAATAECPRVNYAEGSSIGDVVNC